MSVVVVGMGQLGRTFGQGLLAIGETVVPVLRGEAIGAVEPELVLVTVAEKDFDAAVRSIPAALRTRIGLVQNELAPSDWLERGISRPTVACVFFEKKRGRQLRLILPTRIAGPHAELLVRALRAIDVEANAIDDAELPRALLEKNLYILTTNLAGIGTPLTVTQLAAEKRLPAIFDEVLLIERARFGLDEAAVSRDALWSAMMAAFAADPDHVAAGRIAWERLSRTLARADRFGLAVPTLRSIKAAVRA
jgi:hypothetical protein